jgi:hypothetical protein
LTATRHAPYPALIVTPAKAGVHAWTSAAAGWTPAFAGVTGGGGGVSRSRSLPTGNPNPPDMTL